MFREFNGLPLHVLVIHAVVVLVPLLALFAIAYGVLPRWRHRLDWAVAAAPSPSAYQNSVSPYDACSLICWSRSGG